MSAPRKRVRRPAEVAGVTGAVVALVAKLFGVADPTVLISLTIIVGALPALVTTAVNRIPRLRRWLGVTSR